MLRALLTLAALTGFEAVIFGALSDHALSGAHAQLARTGAHYELTHALAVFASVFVARLGGRGALAAGVLFLIGILLFSGSLYALAFGAPALVAMATPVGGLAFLAGWLMLALACARLKLKET
jgi:uncharacterized membrane protein YgdD (TMEM256/DUF423 family)